MNNLHQNSEQIDFCLQEHKDQTHFLKIIICTYSVENPEVIITVLSIQC